MGASVGDIDDTSTTAAARCSPTLETHVSSDGTASSAFFPRVSFSGLLAVGVGAGSPLVRSWRGLNINPHCSTHNPTIPENRVPSVNSLFQSFSQQSVNPSRSPGVVSLKRCSSSTSFRLSRRKVKESVFLGIARTPNPIRSTSRPTSFSLFGAAFFAGWDLFCFCGLLDATCCGFLNNYGWKDGAQCDFPPVVSAHSHAHRGAVDYMSMEFFDVAGFEYIYSSCG